MTSRSLPAPSATATISRNPAREVTTAVTRSGPGPLSGGSRTLALSPSGVATAWVRKRSPAAANRSTEVFSPGPRSSTVQAPSSSRRSPGAAAGAGGPSGPGGGPHRGTRGIPIRSPPASTTTVPGRASPGTRPPKTIQQG